MTSVVLAEVIVGLVVASLVAMFVAIVPTVFLWMVALRRVKTVERLERGEICPCGYDLAGLAPESICPECGQPPEAARLRERFDLVFRPCGRLHLFITCLPVLVTGFLASAGLESGYLRLGFQPTLAARCASEDDPPGLVICMGGVALLGATAALTRRATSGRQTLVLLVTLLVWCLAVFIGYSLDAHRRGLDLTWGLFPGVTALPIVSVAIVLLCAGREFHDDSLKFGRGGLSPG